jgi:hypothetical protein
VLGEKSVEANLVGLLRNGELTHPMLSKPYTRFVPFYEKFGLDVHFISLAPV